LIIVRPRRRYPPGFPFKEKGILANRAFRPGPIFLPHLADGKEG